MRTEVQDLALDQLPEGDGWTVAAVDYTAGKRCWTRQVPEVGSTCRVVWSHDGKPVTVPRHADDDDASAEVKAILSRPVRSVRAVPKEGA